MHKKFQKNLKKGFVLLLIMGLMGCDEVTHVTPCTLVNLRTFDCKPTRPGEPDFDLPARQALGYKCFSPEDIGKMERRVRIERIKLENLENWFK